MEIYTATAKVWTNIAESYLTISATFMLTTYLKESKKKWTKKFFSSIKNQLLLVLTYDQPLPRLSSPPDELMGER